MNYSDSKHTLKVINQIMADVTPPVSNFIKLITHTCSHKNSLIKNFSKQRALRNFYPCTPTVKRKYILFNSCKTLSCYNHTDLKLGCSTENTVAHYVKTYSQQQWEMLLIILIHRISYCSFLVSHVTFQCRLKPRFVSPVVLTTVAIKLCVPPCFYLAP